MDDTVPVRVVQRARDRRRQTHRIVHRQLLLALDPRAQRLALDVGHHIEQQSVGGAAVEEREQIRVLQVRGNLDLAEKALDADDGAEIGRASCRERVYDDV